MIHDLYLPVFVMIVSCSADCNEHCEDCDLKYMGIPSTPTTFLQLRNAKNFQFNVSNADPIIELTDDVHAISSDVQDFTSIKNTKLYDVLERSLMTIFFYRFMAS